MNVFRCALILMPIVFAPNVARPEGDNKDALERIFPTHQAAITNGVVVLDLIRKHTPEAEQKLQQSVGKTAVFHGGAAPPGGSADLVIATNGLLKVEIVPPKDGRPHATYWDAGVPGKIRGIDHTNKVIHIVVRPEDWHAGDTM